MVTMFGANPGCLNRPATTFTSDAKLPPLTAFSPTHPALACSGVTNNLDARPCNSPSTPPTSASSSIQVKMLHLIGLGLADETDITVKGLKIVKKAERVYLESYTAILLVDQEKLVSLGPQTALN